MNKQEHRCAHFGRVWNRDRTPFEPCCDMNYRQRIIADTFCTNGCKFSFNGFTSVLRDNSWEREWLRNGFCVLWTVFKIAQNRFWAWVHKIQLYGKFLLKKWMLSGNLNGKMHIKVYSSGNSDAEKAKADFATWYKKEKIRLWKRGQKIALPMCEKNGPDSPSGLARTARSARLRFCLFRRFVFIQGVCLSRRAQRADLFKTSIRLSAIGVKYRDKSHRVWGVV